MARLLLGAVAYDPKVVTIWDGFRMWLREHDVDFDFLLYSNYESQVEDLVDSRIDVAWNSPLAWVRARRMACARGAALQSFVMRDTDRDLTTAIVVRADSHLRQLPDLEGAIVGVGAVDSPQATLLPLSHLLGQGLRSGSEIVVRRHDVGVGLHGDHIGGERKAVEALLRGEVDAACVTDGSLLLFAQEGTLPAGSVRVVSQTSSYDHCTMTASPTADAAQVAQLSQLLQGMSYADEKVRHLLDLEGLTRWVPARTSGYDTLEHAVDALGFYDQDGRIVVPDYRP